MGSNLDNSLVVFGTIAVRIGCAAPEAGDKQPRPKPGFGRLQAPQSTGSTWQLAEDLDAKPRYIVPDTTA